MKFARLFYFLVLASVLILSGCVTRTYSLTKDRVDQDLTSGNKGYLTGKAKAEETAPRKTDRTIRVFEIELGKSYKAKQADVPLAAQPNTEGSAETADKGTSIATAAEGLNAPASGNIQKYTVGKNDTLQKISQKFYGTTKKWTKIYNANKDVLSGPDKVYPGQTLNIPDISEIKPVAETLNEPKENLK